MGITEVAIDVCVCVQLMLLIFVVLFLYIFLDSQINIYLIFRGIFALNFVFIIVHVCVER